MPNGFEGALIDALPELRRYAATLRIDPASRNDLVQATVERALRSRDRYQPSGPFVGWLLVIMQNLFLDQMRRQRLADRAAWELGAPRVQFPNQVATLELRDLKRALAGLRPQDLRLLGLVVRDGLSYEAAAEREGIPIGTVRSRLARARERLAEAVHGATVRLPLR